MALSLPDKPGTEPDDSRDVILVLTYVSVVFSILVQGLTVGPLTRRWLRPRVPGGEAAPRTEECRAGIKPQKG